MQNKYLRLLSEKYPSIQAVSREIINLNAILNLPKGTEHFMSDIHGEYEAFCHILNNCSGVIREKVGEIFSETLSDAEIEEICTLIYYPDKKLELLKAAGRVIGRCKTAVLKIHPFQGTQGYAGRICLYY